MGIVSKNDDDGSDSDDDDDDDDDDEEKLAPGQQKKRQQSELLQKPIDKHWTGVECRPKSTDGSWMLDFFEDSIGEFDFGSKNKKSGRYTWTDQNYEDLKDILTKLQYICMFFQRNDTESIRTFLSTSIILRKNILPINTQVSIIYLLVIILSTSIGEISSKRIEQL